MSDYLSRHPVTTAEKPSQSRIAEEYVLFIADQDVPKAMTMQEIVQKTPKDSDLQKVISNVRHKTWKKLTHQTTTLIPFRMSRISYR